MGAFACVSRLAFVVARGAGVGFDRCLVGVELAIRAVGGVPLPVAPGVVVHASCGSGGVASCGGGGERDRGEPQGDASHADA